MRRNCEFAPGATLIIHWVPVKTGQIGFHALRLCRRFGLGFIRRPRWAAIFRAASGSSGLLIHAATAAATASHASSARRTSRRMRSRMLIRRFRTLRLLSGKLPRYPMPRLHPSTLAPPPPMLRLSQVRLSLGSPNRVYPLDVPSIAHFPTPRFPVTKTRRSVPALGRHASAHFRRNPPNYPPSCFPILGNYPGYYTFSLRHCVAQWPPRLPSLRIRAWPALCRTPPQSFPLRSPPSA